MLEQNREANSVQADVLASQLQQAHQRPAVGLWALVKRQPAGAVAALALFTIVFSGVFAEVVSTQDPTAQNLQESLWPPGAIARDGFVYLLGTDDLGRDIYSRVVHGARISLTVGVAAVLLGTVGGLLLGMLSAYRGSWTDMIIQRVTDSMQAIPTLILAMLLVAPFLENPFVPKLAITAFAIGITQIPRANRVIRSNVLSVIQEPYVEAAKAMGAREARIIFQHIMPNVMATTLIVFSTSIGAAIVTEATLSFLGLAADPPLATWGAMMTLQGRQYMLFAPWIIIAPATALSVTVLTFNFLGDSIRDVLDPRLRGR